MLTTGTYDGTVFDASLSTSAKGTLSVRVIVDIDDPDTGTPVRMTGNIWITERALGMARGQLKHLGFDIDAHDLSEIDHGVLKGAACKVKLGIENYQGQDTLKIQMFGGEMKPKPAEIAKAQAALRAAKSKKAESQPELPPMAAAAAVVNDDEPPPTGEGIPF